MPRALTAEETAVLAHVVVDPEVWWAHANEAENIPDPEAALAAKIDRWKSKYEASLLYDGVGYKNRAQREAEK